jgi:hypothetical protein
MTQIVLPGSARLSQLVTETRWDRKTFEKINGQDARWPARQDVRAPRRWYSLCLIME